MNTVIALQRPYYKGKLNFDEETYLGVIAFGNALGNSIVRGAVKAEYNKNVSLNNKLAGYSQQLTKDAYKNIKGTGALDLNVQLPDLSQVSNNFNSFVDNYAAYSSDYELGVSGQLSDYRVSQANSRSADYQNRAYDLTLRTEGQYLGALASAQNSFNTGSNRGYSYFADSIAKHQRFAQNSQRIVQLNQDYYDNNYAASDKRSNNIAALKQSLANSDYVFKLDKPKSRVPSELNALLTDYGVASTIGLAADLTPESSGLKFGTTFNQWQDGFINQRILGVSNYTGIGGSILTTNINDISKNSQWLFNTNYASNAFKLGSMTDGSFNSLAELSWRGLSNGLDKFGKGVFWAQTAIGGFDFTYNAAFDYGQTGSVSQNTWDIGKNALVDTVFGAAGVYGGPVGAVISLSWTYRQSLINSEIQQYQNELNHGFTGPRY